MNASASWYGPSMRTWLISDTLVKTGCLETSNMVDEYGTLEWANWRGKKEN